MPCPNTIDDCQLFVTITLPPRYYRKSVQKQADIMLNYLKFIQVNLFDYMEGALELTLKGNVHAHFLGKYKEGFFDGIPFKNDKAKHTAYITAIKTSLNKFSLNDVQIIKSKEWVSGYCGKDYLVSEKILERKPTFKFPTEQMLKKINHTIEDIKQEPKEICTSCLDWEINIINDSFKK